MDATEANNQTLTYKYIFTDLADPRTNGYFLIGSPISLYTILFSYLYFVKVCGPKFMKNRKPYELKRTIQIYNLLQILANLWLFNEAQRIWRNYNWSCEPVDYSDSPSALRVSLACYLYFLNKISDLLDTVFFVLRKKDRQITFLHVFHHTLMPFATWHVTKYFPGGHLTFIGLVNTFVHVLLYGYYYLASLGPEVQKYLWWKKYLTRIQLIQFCMVFIHNSQLFIYDCGYPKWTVWFTLPNAVFFYYLFNDFYQKSYTEVNTKKEEIANGATKSAKTD